MENLPTTGGIVNTLFALVFAISFVALLWGLMLYFGEMGSEPAKREHKSIVIAAITWLFLLMCLYAVVEWLRGLAGI